MAQKIHTFNQEIVKKYTSIYTYNKMLILRLCQQHGLYSGLQI